jgi:hypothetical protein
MANSIELEFGDGTYLFALPLAQISELQRKCGIGIGGLFNRVLKGCNRLGDDIILAPGQAEFYALDLIETIRHALIGGGKGTVNGEEVKVTPIMASRLIDAYVLTRPLSDSWSIAASVLGACIVGYTPPKKATPADERAPGKPAVKKRKTKRAV